MWNLHTLGLTGTMCSNDSWTYRLGNLWINLSCPFITLWVHRMISFMVLWQHAKHKHHIHLCSTWGLAPSSIHWEKVFSDWAWILYHHSQGMKGSWPKNVLFPGLLSDSHHVGNTFLGFSCLVKWLSNNLRGQCSFLSCCVLTNPQSSKSHTWFHPFNQLILAFNKLTCGFCLVQNSPIWIRLDTSDIQLAGTSM